MWHLDELVLVFSYLHNLSLLFLLLGIILNSIFLSLMSSGVEADIGVFEHGAKTDLLSLDHLELIICEFRQHIRQQFVICF